MFSKKSNIVQIDTGIAFSQTQQSQWNNMISDFKDFLSFLDLKKHLISLIRPERKDVFNVFRPSVLRYLFQLRVGLSRLRHHKKSHNFIDTPSDLCLCKTGVEDTRHYLLVCPFYANHRDVLFSTVENIIRDKDLNQSINSSDLFLYGDSSLSVTDNQSIISATLTFIAKLQSFSFVNLPLPRVPFSPFFL